MLLSVPLGVILNTVHLIVSTAPVGCPIKVSVGGLRECPVGVCAVRASSSATEQKLYKVLNAPVGPILKIVPKLLVPPTSVVPRQVTVASLIRSALGESPSAQELPPL